MDPDERLNNEGLMRHQLVFALQTARYVHKARSIDRCLLCRRTKVNEAGLCGVCYAVIDDDERKLARRWITGELQ